MNVLLLTDHPDGPDGAAPALRMVLPELRWTALDNPPQDVSRLDVLVVDTASNLSGAVALCRAPLVRAASTPLLLIVDMATLAALKLSWGWDDWVLGSCGAPELRARLRMLVEARGTVAATSYVGPLLVDEERFEVRVHDEVLDLTFREFELLRALWSRPGRVWTRDALLREVWEYGDAGGGSRTVDVHIRRLRAKLGPEIAAHIQTIRGVGYKFEPAPATVEATPGGDAPQLIPLP